ncbi:MAG: hypothetical protein VB118_12120 [Oscillospiraceae bacterium]|nr:hypothetical protein [Oscillospiraceae bacterium]
MENNNKEVDEAEKTSKNAEATSAEKAYVFEKGAEERIRSDIVKLRELFPSLKNEDIPDEVWERVKNGESLAASYALYFIENIKSREKIRELNEKNNKNAPPRFISDGGEENYFSPETVKQMSPAAIRKNYDTILKSMDSWK